MKRRLAVLLAGVCLLLMLGGCGAQKKEAEPTAAAVADVTGSTEDAGDTAETVTSEAQLLTEIDETAPGYVLVQTNRFSGFLALPAEGEERREIRQAQEDGSEWVNVLMMTPEGFVMIESDCPGHDCEQQGMVTLENMQDRVLWNMIICAPHQLTLSLYTPAEAAALAERQK